MTEPTFNEKIVVLREEWLKHPFDDQKSPDFWAIMNSISEDQAAMWSSRLLNLNNKSRDFYNSMTYNNLDTDDLLTIQSVLFDYKRNEKTIFYDKEYHKLTKSQKFLLLFKIIKYWEHLEITYVI